MSKSSWLVVALALALGATAVGCATTPEPMEGGTGEAPEAVVQSFYDWYVEAAAFDPEAGSRGAPLQEGLYRDRPELSEAFVAELDATLADPAGLVADPLLCAQDVPETVTPGEASLEGETASVPVTTSFSGHSFTVELVKADTGWRIDGVACAAP